MRLTGQAALDYLKKNPNASYTDNITGTKVAAQKSGLSKFVSNVTSPFRKGAGVAQEFGYTMADLLNIIQGKQAVERPEAYALMTPEESQALYQDPLKTGLKSGVGVASYAMGGGAAKGATAGARILNATKASAVGGAAGGFGYSEDGKELSGTLAGGAIGGVLGGGLQGLSELLKPVLGAKAGVSKLSKGGTELRGKTIGLDPNALASSRSSKVNSVTQGKKAIKSYLNTMDEFGLSTNTSRLASESADEGLRILKEGGTANNMAIDGFDDILKSADDAITFDSKTSVNLIKEINKKLPSNIKSPVYDEILADITGLGNNYKPSQLNAVREKIRDTFINWNAKQGLKQSSQRAADTSFDVLDKFFKDNVPGAAENLSKANAIYTVRDFIQKKAARSGVMKVGTASTNVGIPTFGLDERLGSLAGKTMEKMPSMSLRNQGVSDVLGKAAGYAGPAGGVLTGLTNGMQTQEQVPMDMNTASDEGAGVSELNMMLAQEVLKGNLSAAEANAVLSLLGQSATTTKKTDLQRKAESALTSIDKLEGLLSANGNSMLLEQLLPFQGGSSQAQIYNSAATDIMDTLARLRTGAVINEAEEKMYRGYIPKITDTPERRVYKLQLLRQVFGSMANATPTTTTTTTIQ